MLQPITPPPTITTRAHCGSSMPVTCHEGARQRRVACQAVGVSDPGAAPAAVAEKQTGRLEAFSDGVLAVVITIMALELRAPVGGSFSDLHRSLPGLFIYALSFAF